MTPAVKFALRLILLAVCASQALAQSPTPQPLPNPHPAMGPLGATPPLLPAPMPMPSPMPMDIIPTPLPPGVILEDAAGLYQQIVALHAAGNYADAVPLAERNLAAVERSAGADSLAHAAAISLLARLNQARGQLAVAEGLMKRALAIQERDNGPELEVAGNLDALAQLYQSQGKLDEAEPLFKRALAINEKASGPDQTNVGRSLNNLAWLYQEQGRYTEAEPLAARALAVIETALGSKHPDHGRALDTLAKLNEGLGRISEAEPLYRRALEILEPALGAEHESVAVTRENLGGLVKSQGRLAEAEPLLKAALQSKERVFGSDHASLANSLAQLGDLYRVQGRVDEAEIYFRRALAIRKTAIREVPIFFATNRKRDQESKSVAFGGDRSQALAFGQAAIIVAKPQPVPRHARLAPSASDASSPTGAADIETTEVTRLAIRDISLAPDDRAHLKSARQRVESADSFPSQAFVFVHGFNVSFENALRRTAQIAYDLNFDGAAFLFSWPSRDSLWSYTTDRESAEIAVDHLREFLDRVVAQSGAKKIHLVAHSMGNVVLLNALEKIKLGQGAQPGERFSEIILHSPDVDSDRFGQLMKAIKGIGSGVTLYASTNDRALGLSGWLWGVVRRAGAGPSVVPGVETIDVTAAGSSLLGLNHDLYATNPAIFNDMRLVIQHGKHPPDARSQAFEPTATDEGTYWLYRRPDPSAAQ